MCLVTLCVAFILIKLESGALLMFHHSLKLYMQHRSDYLFVAEDLLTQLYLIFYYQGQ